MRLIKDPLENKKKYLAGTKENRAYKVALFIGRTT
jgi:hypothetical protein